MSKDFQSSKIIKIAMVGIKVLVGVQLISFLYIGIFIYLISISPKEIGEIYFKIVELLNAITITGSVATIVTAVIARYGLRETASSININRSNQTGGQNE